MGEDFLEQYGRCPQVYRFARVRLGLHCRFASSWEYWLLTATEDPDTCRDKWWERMAWLHYSVLRATNAARLCGGIGGDEAARALWEATLEGARGSNLLSWLPQQSSAIETAGEAEREAAASSASAAAVSTAAAAVQQPPGANRTTTATTTTTIQWATEATTLDRFKYYFQQF